MHYKIIMGAYLPLSRFILRTTALMALILSLSGPAFGQHFCTDSFDRRKAGQPETAIELELPLTEQVASLITTRDGTLQPLFFFAKDIPPEIRREIEQLHPDFRTTTLSFDSLPRRLKHRLLKAAIPAMNRQFESAGYRRIPGLVLQPAVLDRYPLLNYVEFGSPQSVRTAEMIEIHMRKAGKASELIQKAKALHKSLGYSGGSLHMHIVLKQDRFWMKQNPIVNAFRLADFWRRLNIVMEMRDVIERKATIYYNSNIIDDFVYHNFGPLDSESFDSGLRYLLSLGLFNEEYAYSDMSLGADAKIAWVGLWGHDKYDAMDSFGFEFRSLRTDGASDSLLQFLDNVKGRVEGRQFGVDETAMIRWLDQLEKVNKEASGDRDSWREHFSFLIRGTYGLGLMAIHRLVPHKPYEDVMGELSFEMRKLILGMGRENAQSQNDVNALQAGEEKFKAHFLSRKRLSYLLHDWSLDPLYFENPQQVQKIKQLQLKALRQWMRGKDETQVIQEFLLESGIYFTMAESVGLNP